MQQDTQVIERQLPYAEVARDGFIRMLVFGLGFGILAAMLSVAIANWVIVPLFCNSTDSFSVCANGGNYAAYAVTLLVNGFAAWVLIRYGVFRPLLIVLASTITLWGLHPYIAQLSWFEYGLWTALLYSLSYAFFYLVSHIRNFAITAAIILVVAALARWILLA